MYNVIWGGKENYTGLQNSWLLLTFVKVILIWIKWP